jgi:hypothetical protein
MLPVSTPHHRQRAAADHLADGGGESTDAGGQFLGGEQNFHDDARRRRRIGHGPTWRRRRYYWEHDVVDIDLFSAFTFFVRQKTVLAAGICIHSLFSTLSLWERAGVRVHVTRAHAGHPHPACGRPLPEGEATSPYGGRTMSTIGCSR